MLLFSSALYFTTTLHPPLLSSFHVGFLFYSWSLALCQGCGFTLTKY